MSREWDAISEPLIPKREQLAMEDVEPLLPAFERERQYLPPPPGGRTFAEERIRPIKDSEPLSRAAGALGQAKDIWEKETGESEIEKTTPGETPEEHKARKQQEFEKDFERPLRLQRGLEELAPTPENISKRFSRVPEVLGEFASAAGRKIGSIYETIERMETDPRPPSMRENPAQAKKDIGQLGEVLVGGGFGVPKVIGELENLARMRELRRGGRPHLKISEMEGLEGEELHAGGRGFSDKHLNFGPKLGGHVDIKTNFPEADFWLVRTHGAKGIGRPTNEFNPNHIGIRVRNHNIDPRYLQYAFEAAYNQGGFAARGRGTGPRVRLSVRDIENLDVAKIMRGSAEFRAFGTGPKPKITALVKAMEGREDFEALSEEIYQILTKQRRNIVTEAAKNYQALASKDPKLMRALMQLQKGTSHEFISELADQIAARQIYERMFGHGNFELKAFGGSGPGGRITISDVEQLGKQAGAHRVKTRIKTNAQGKESAYVTLTRYGKSGAREGHGKVRVPLDEASHGGREAYPGEPVLDTTDAPYGRGKYAADPMIAANRGGGRYNDINNLRDAIDWMFGQRKPGFHLLPEEQAPKIRRPSAEPVEPPAADPAQMPLPWNETRGPSDAMVG